MEHPGQFWSGTSRFKWSIFGRRQQPKGKNISLSPIDTISAEGRQADHIYYIASDGASDLAAMNVGKQEQNKSTWSLLAVDQSTMTNCTFAATKVLSSVNSWIDGMTKWQIPTPWNFNSVLNVLSNWQTSGTANTGVYKIR